MMNSVTLHILNLFGRDPNCSCYYHHTCSQLSCCSPYINSWQLAQPYNLHPFLAQEVTYRESAFVYLFVRQLLLTTVSRGGGGANIPDFDALFVCRLSNQNCTCYKSAECCLLTSSSYFTPFLIPRLLNESDHLCSLFLACLMSGLCLSLLGSALQLGTGHLCTLFLVSLISFASPFSDPSSVTTPSFRCGLSGP